MLLRYYSTTWRYSTGERCYAVRDRTRNGACEVFKYAYTARERRDGLNELQGEYHERE